MHPEFAPIAFIAAFSLLLPLPWHWRASNVATLAIMFWLFVANVIYAIDAVVWADSVDIVATVWCDITTKLIIGSNIALPAACLCICIHLEQVASVRLARTSQSDKRRRQMFELLMCFALPVLYMLLHYIVQGHRFDIIQDYGCRPTVFFSIPSIFLIWIPPILLSLASLVFGGLALRHFIHRRISFAAHLDASHSALTTSRYLRLMLMAILEMIWSITVTSYTLWFTTVSIPLRPYISWADVHSNFSRIDTYPTLFMPGIVVRAYYFLWWLVPVSTFAFVAMFAFGRDAVEEYKKCFLAARKIVPVPWRKPASSTAKKSGFDTRGAMELPSYEAKSTVGSAPTYLPSPPSPSKFREALNDLDYDSHSETSSHMGPTLSYHGPDADTTPTSTSQPERASPWFPRAQRPLAESPRPVTYPSFDASHRGIDLSAGT
ncbi:pheromone A receptor-domain-containing protein [Mycena crocata]|nr:pheromone A receptor-domain-containing protein [Mycena crocata]